MARRFSLLVACQREGWSTLPALGARHSLGVEIGDFADPEVLDGDWRRHLETIAPHLQAFPGERALHGPRSDLNPGLRDPGLVAFCRQRYLRALDVAAAVGAGTVVFHTGYNPLIRARGFDRRWVRRSADFWRDLAEEAAARGLMIVLENVWEPSPRILCQLIDAIGLPTVRACFDVGHANIYSRRRLGDWCAALGERMTTVHLHNNDGRIDEHLPLEEGTIDFGRFLPLLALAPNPPRLVLEISGKREEIEDALFFVRRLLALI